MGRLRATVLLLAVLAASLLLAACGSSKGKGELLPGTTADQINANLDTVRESAKNGDCEKAEVAVAEVSNEIDELGQVNEKLKAALAQGAEKLSEVVSPCGQAEQEAEEKQAEEAEEQEQLESQEEEQAEEESLEEDQKEQEQEQKAKEKAEKEAKQPEPPTGGEESTGKGEAKGPEKQEEEVVEPESGEIEVTPPGGGAAGGIGPGASVEGGG